jgi:CRP-like cAMP-binding protein
LPVRPALHDYVVDEKLAVELAKRARPYPVQANDVLFRKGDAPKGIYLLRQGNVELTIHSGDQVVVCARAGAGSVLGLPSTVDDMPYSMTATVCQEAEIEHLSSKDFHQLIERHPELYLNVVQILAAEVRSVRKALGDLLS